MNREEDDRLRELSQFLGWTKSEILRHLVRHLLSFYSEIKGKGIVIPDKYVKWLVKTYLRIGEFSPVRIDLEKGVLLLDRAAELDEFVALFTFKKLLMSRYEKIKYNRPQEKITIDELRKELQDKFKIHEYKFNDYLKKLTQIGECVLEEGEGEEGLNLDGKNFVYVKELKED